MNESLEHIILLGSILLIISIFVSKTSVSTGIPTLILFLVIGMLAGSDGIGGIEFDDPHIAQVLGVIALNFILFSGGMETKWESIKPIVWRGVALSTIGVAVTALTVGLFVHYITDFSLLEGLLLGSIVASTDAAAVFSILRTRKLGLKGHIRPTLELESGSNDALAYLLTITLIYIIKSGDISPGTLAVKFLQQMVVGAIAGFSLGKLMIYILNRIRLEAEGLYPVLVLALIFFTFSFTDIIGGNGFLAVYLAALVLGNSDFIHKKSLIRFYDGQAWLMQIVMFLTLGLLVFPSQILPISGIGVLISIFLMFVARPAGVFLSLIFFRVNIREKLFISWVGLRGAVPIVFATYPLIEGISNASMIFNLVFFISVSSVLLQGSTLALVARWLKVTVPEKVKRRFPVDLELSDTIKSELLEIEIPEHSKAVDKPIVKLGFPHTASIVMLKRDNKYIMPKGSTVLEGGDKLFILANSKDDWDEVQEALDI
jgi:cell volume regulation protein A